MPAVRTQSHPTLAATPSPYGARSRTAKAVPLNGDASCLLGVETARDANTQVDADVGDPLGPQVDDPAPSRATAYPTTLPTRSRFRLEGGRAVTGHQWKVYDFILRIPPGRVTTYALISSALGSSSQAVGGALRNNPFAPFVPCHRVIASTLFIGGFEGEWAELTEGKKAEGRIAKKLELLEQEGVRFDEKGYLVGGKEALWGK